MDKEEYENIKADARAWAENRVGAKACKEECQACWRYRCDMPCHQYELMVAYMVGAGAFDDLGRRDEAA